MGFDGESYMRIQHTTCTGLIEERPVARRLVPFGG